mmetsp:Transcript_93078/g.300853  ORF Transcript_93078/g.300853 Transcript_93078/m.300853 type:complete len:280 (+) Transcript_93078:782-1621(+)
MLSAGVGAVFGRGTAGAILEDDLSALLSSFLTSALEAPLVGTLPTPDCVVSLARENTCHCSAVTDMNSAAKVVETCECGVARVPAHRLLLASRCGFFDASLRFGLGEQRSLVIHLGIVEDLGVWRPGEDPRPGMEAFRSLLRFLYTSQTEHVKAEHALDVLALLANDFLQLPDALLLQRACEEALTGEMGLDTAAAVASRAHQLEHPEAEALAVDSLAAVLMKSPQPAGAVRRAAAGLPRAAAAELMERLAAAACASVPPRALPVSREDEEKNQGPWIA